MSKLYRRSQLSWNAPHASHFQALLTTWDIKTSQKLSRTTSVPRIVEKEQKEKNQIQETLGHKTNPQFPNNLLPNYYVAQIRARNCVTQTQKLEGAEWIESHWEIRALLFNRTFRSRTRQLVSPATGPQLPENRQTSGQKVHRFRRPLVTPCRNQFTNPTLRRSGKEIATMGGRKGEILKSTDTAMVRKVEEARRLQQQQQLLWSLLPRKALGPTSMICEDLVHHLSSQVSPPES